MEFHILTLFPEFFESPLSCSLLARAIKAGHISVTLHQLRNYGLGRYRQVDDAPYGGGHGMVMRPEPIAAAIDDILSHHPGLWKVILSPQGERLTQQIVRDLARHRPGLLLIAGRYEGFDERVRTLVDQEISIGDYVLAGGEVAALVVLETVARLVPGVVGNPESLEEESFASGLLEYPQYTRPREFRGLRVPDVLLSGDHEKIRKWRRQQAIQRTLERRPDLLTNKVED